MVCSTSLRRNHVRLTYCNTRVRIGSLHEFLALVSYHPVGIDLRGSFRIQMHHLELSKVGDTDAVILGAHVKDVGDAVVVKVVFACVTSSISCLGANHSKQLVRYMDPSYIYISIHSTQELFTRFKFRNLLSRCSERTQI